MSPQDFSYWLQGFFELTETNKLSEKQVLMIKEHLNLVFHKVTSTQGATSTQTPHLPAQPLSKKETEDLLESVKKWKEREEEKASRKESKAWWNETSFPRDKRIC